MRRAEAAEEEVRRLRWELDRCQQAEVRGGQHGIPPMFDAKSFTLLFLCSTPKPSPSESV